MEQLIILYRTKQLLSHNCHNLMARSPFFSDHEYFSELYNKAEEHYDEIVERMIGLGKTPDLINIQIQAAQKLTQIPLTYKENSECFQTIVGVNKQILALIEGLIKTAGLSQGAINLLAGQADELEVELYKLGQRVKK